MQVNHSFRPTASDRNASSEAAWLQVNPFIKDCRINYGPLELKKPSPGLRVIKITKTTAENYKREYLEIGVHAIG